MNAMDLIRRELAKAKTHEVVTIYECGKVRRLETTSLAAAETHAIGERRKIGRQLVDRESGRAVKVVSVEMRAL